MFSRRTALKAMVGSLAVPLVRLRPEIDRERILQSFCDDYVGIRYNLSQPFGVGSLTYATDARHMVRTELVNRVEDGERRVPPFESAWKRYWSPAGEFVPFDIPSPSALTEHCEFVPCPVCGDRRISLGSEYPEFDDEGLPRNRRLIVYGYDVDTNTIRDKSCDCCNGLRYQGPNVLRVHGVLMDYRRLLPIWQIPNVRITRSHVPDGEALLFSGDGFQGIALGLSE